MFCPQCGIQAVGADRFCRECGSPMPLPASGPIAPGAAAPASSLPEGGFGKELSEAVSEDMAAWPWARFLARQIDLVWQAWLISFAFGLFSPQQFAALDVAIQHNNLVFGMVLLPGALLLDAMCMAVFGTTPGKALAMIRVRHDGKKLTFPQALTRNLGVYFYGFALGLPLFNLFAMAFSARRLRLKKQARWDESPGRSVTGERLHWLHWVLLVVICAGLFVVSIMFGMLLEAQNRAAAKQAAGQAASAYRAPAAAQQPASLWTNPATGRGVMIPSAWKVDTGLEGVVTFVHASSRHVVMIGQEDLDFDIPPDAGPLLDRYLAALEKSNPSWGKAAGYLLTTAEENREPGLMFFRGGSYPSANLGDVPAEMDAMVWTFGGRKLWRTLVMRERGIPLRTDALELAKALRQSSRPP